MTDVDVRGFATATAAIELHSTSLIAYHDATRQQQEALRTGDFDRIEAIAEQIDAILAAITDAGRSLEPILARLRRRTVDGPRARAVRQMLRALEADAETTAASVRDLAAQLIGRRDEVATELDLVDALLRAARTAAPAAPEVLAAAPRALDLVG